MSDLGVLEGRVRPWVRLVEEVASCEIRDESCVVKASVEEEGWGWVVDCLGGLGWLYRDWFGGMVVGR